MMGDGVIELRRLREAAEAGGYSRPIEVEIFNQVIWDTPGDKVLAAGLFVGALMLRFLGDRVIVNGRRSIEERCHRVVDVPMAGVVEVLLFEERHHVGMAKPRLGTAPTTASSAWSLCGGKLHVVLIDVV